jgi:hypothetical protein
MTPGKEGAMTEAEWLACVNPEPMLIWLRSKGSERKLRLFACACCRRIWEQLTDERSRNAVDIAEQRADRMTSAKKLTAAELAARSVWKNDGTIPYDEQRRCSSTAAANAADKNAYAAGHSMLETARISEGMERAKKLNLQSPRFNWATFDESMEAAKGYWTEAYAEIDSAYCGFLRDIFGNPFRRVALDPAWLHWNGGTVRQMAETIYDDRAFDQLPILADALEEAGCTDRAVLDHCRGAGDHVRGCWMLDLLLGKE